MKTLSTIIATVFLLALNAYAADSPEYAGVKTLSLNNSQLNRIGVKVSGSYLEVHISKTTKLLIKSGKIDVVSCKSPAPAGLNCYPRFVVNEFSNGSCSYFNKPEDMESPVDVNSLVCVRIDAQLTSRNKTAGSVVYLWYDCTDDLVMLLPTYKKVELMAEVFDSAGVNAREPAYTDMYRMFSGALASAMIRPNPVSGDAGALQFRLDESRIVNIAMYDICGNYRKDFVTDSAFETGEHNVALDMTDYSDGMYIIVITTNRNERVIQRIIKAH